MEKSSPLKAFSLVEMSLVLLLISAVIIGMLKGSSLIGKSRLAAAQTITKKSPVNDLTDLVAWFETSLDTSFLPSEKKDGSLISVWHDNNPDASTRNNATQENSLFRPRYYKDIFNVGIPGIRFDGADDLMLFNGSFLVNSNYTVFVVEKRESNKNSSFFIGGSNSDNNSNLHLGYNSSTSLTFGHNSSDLLYSVEAYQDPIEQFHTFYFNYESGKKYWLNGGTNEDASESEQNSALQSYDNPAIGRSESNYYSGSIAEIIIFSRALKISEKELVETYLSKKYNIKID